MIQSPVSRPPSRINCLRPAAIVVNVARCTLLDQKSLIRIRGAVQDVF